MSAPPLPPRSRPRLPVATASGIDERDLIDEPASEEWAERRLFEAGHVIAGKYRLERPAGFGGMAELWVATNQATGAEVCVKLLNPSGDDEAEAVERFHREARAAAKLSHRAIVRVFDLLELDERGEATSARPRAYAIVMELLHGETLGDLIARREKLPVNEALDLFLPVVSALAHAHRASVIHRDIKPDNVFLARDPDDQIIPKILDFGVSKLENAETITIDGVLVGTPSFMSPEQARGSRKLDARSDVFSAGILFYMMLTGRNPFDDGPFASVVEAVLHREVQPVEGLVPEIWAVLQQAIEKDPARRFGDATEMGIALRKAAGRKGTESNPVLPVAAPASRAGDPSAARPRSAASIPSGLEAETASGPPSSFTTRPESVFAKRRGAIVASVFAACVSIVIVAIVASFRGPKLVEPSAQAAVLGAPPSHEPRPSEPPPSASAPPPVLEPAPVAAVVAPPRAASAEPAASTKPPGRAPSAKSVRGVESSAVMRPRKPGQEPSSARGPGF